MSGKIRHDRSRLKAGLRNGSITLLEVMASNPDTTQDGMRIRDILTALPYVGHYRADQMMKACGIHGADVRLGDLTREQRIDLAALNENRRKR